MTFDELVGFAPAEKREEAKKVSESLLAGYVRIDSRDIAERLLGENDHLKSAVDSRISKGVAAFEERFKAEKLNGLIEEEIKKRGPKPKDPELAAALDRVEKLEKENAEKEQAANRAAQKARAIAALTAKGFPGEFADRYIGANDEETDANVKAFIGLVEPLVKKMVDDGVKARIGGADPRGGDDKPANLDELYAAAEKAGNGIEMLRLKALMQKARN